MPVGVKITKNDIENIALKLDEFATILNERERILLATLFRMTCEPGAQNLPPQEDEPLSVIFLAACQAAMGSSTEKLQRR